MTSADSTVDITRCQQSVSSTLTSFILDRQTTERELNHMLQVLELRRVNRHYIYQRNMFQSQLPKHFLLP